MLLCDFGALKQQQQNLKQKQDSSSNLHAASRASASPLPGPASPTRLRPRSQHGNGKAANSNLHNDSSPRTGNTSPFARNSESLSPLRLSSPNSPQVPTHKNYKVHAGRRAGADAVAMSRESVLLDGAIARCGMEGVTRVVSNVTFRGGAGAGIGSSQEDMLRRDVLLALDKIRNAASEVHMDHGAVGTAAAGIVNATVTSISQRLFLVSGAEAINPQQYQEVCRDLNDTKSKLERANNDLMSSQAAYQALEEQLQKTEEAAKSGGVLVLGGDEIASKLQETLIDNKKLERKIAELNTVVGQLRGQIKVLEAKLKDAALAQQSNVPEAILQLRGRWSSCGSSAASAGIDDAAIHGSGGGLGIGMGVGGSSSSEVLQLRAEIEKCVRDMQSYKQQALDSKLLAQDDHRLVIDLRIKLKESLDELSMQQFQASEAASELERCRTSRAELQLALDEEKQKIVRMRLANDEMIAELRQCRARAEKQADYIQKKEATWRRLQAKFADSSKGTVEGGGSHDFLDLSEVGRNGDDTREAEPDE